MNCGQFQSNHQTFRLTCVSQQSSYCKWLTGWGSNPQKTSELTARCSAYWATCHYGGRNTTWTCDECIFSAPLYQLSYSPKNGHTRSWTGVWRLTTDYNNRYTICPYLYLIVTVRERLLSWFSITALKVFSKINDIANKINFQGLLPQNNNHYGQMNLTSFGNY